MDKKTAVSVTTMVSGGAGFIREVGVPFARDLETSCDNTTVEFARELPEFLDHDSGFRNDGGVSIGVSIGVGVFLASWAGEKVLDEIYDKHIKTHVQKALGTSDAKLAGADSKKPRMLQVGISYNDEKVFILIGLIGDTFDEILVLEPQIKQIHGLAKLWIEANNFDSTVHLYLLRKDRCNLKPVEFATLNSAHQYLRDLKLSSMSTGHNKAMN